MKKVLFISYFALFVILINSTNAQHNSNTELLKSQIKNTYELGVGGLGYNYINFMPEVYLNGFQQSKSYGLMFKRSLNKKLILRVVAETDRFSVSHAGTQYYEVADSMDISGNYSGNKFSLGIERRWVAGKRLCINGGIDAQFAQYIYRGSMQHLPSIYKHIDNAIYSNVSISPFIGLQYTVMQKFNLGVETSFSGTFIHRNSYIEVVRPEPGTYQKTSNYFDVNPNPIRRVFVTYSF